jgi:hypothetical protein
LQGFMKGRLPLAGKIKAGLSISIVTNIPGIK